MRSSECSSVAEGIFQRCRDILDQVIRIFETNRKAQVIILKEIFGIVCCR